jgi:hypothetical protein
MRRGLVMLVFMIGGCAGMPIFGSSGLRTNFPSTESIETQCVVSERRGTVADVVAQSFAHDWRLAYVSEYTTANSGSVNVLMCFERLRPHTSAETMRHPDTEASRPSADDTTRHPDSESDHAASSPNGARRPVGAH